MDSIMKGIIIGVILCLGMSLSAQTEKEFIIGTFEYCKEESNSLVVIGKKKVVETISGPGGDVVITSKIKWIADNKYQLTISKVKGGSNLTKGYAVIVFVKEIKDGKVEVTFTFSDGQKMSDCFQKVN
jgi:hypothetical protein